jgi:hypothetical protein
MIVLMTQKRIEQLEAAAAVVSAVMSPVVRAPVLFPEPRTGMPGV